MHRNVFKATIQDEINNKLYNWIITEKKNWFPKRLEEKNP